MNNTICLYLAINVAKVPLPNIQAEGGGNGELTANYIMCVLIRV